MSSKQLTPKVCPEQARELIMEWLIPLTENGTMDELQKAFVAELVPYAAAAAERALARNLLKPDPVLTLARFQTFLKRVHSTLEGVLLNPDMVAVAQDSEADLYQVIIETADWIKFLDTDPLTPIGVAAKEGGL